MTSGQQFWLQGCHIHSEELTVTTILMSVLHVGDQSVLFWHHFLLARNVLVLFSHKERQTELQKRVKEVGYIENTKVQTSLLWLSSGQFWFREGMEGDLFGVTSTGEAEKPTSGAGSGTPETYIQTDNKELMQTLEHHSAWIWNQQNNIAPKGQKHHKT